MEKKPMKIEDIRELCKEAHENAVRHGFWNEEHDIRHYLMLVITELAEAVQAYRKGGFAKRNMYEKIVKERSYTKEMAYLLSVKGTFEEKMADACIRLMDLTGRFDVELPTDINIIRTEGEDITVTLFKAIFFMHNALCRDAGALVMYLIRLSEALGIDIEWHIRLKMAYNASRPYLHGNKF